MPRPRGHLFYIDSYRENSSNVFSSETTGQIKAKFHMYPQWIGELKFICGIGQAQGSLVLHRLYRENSSKHLLRNHWAKQSQISYGSSMDRGTEIYSWHLAKMAAMPVYGKNPLKIFSRIQMTNGSGAWYAALGIWSQIKFEKIITFG